MKLPPPIASPSAVLKQAESVGLCLSSYAWKTALDHHIHEFQTEHRKMGRQDRGLHRDLIYFLVRWGQVVDFYLPELKLSPVDHWRARLAALAAWAWNFSDQEVQALSSNALATTTILQSRLKLQTQWRLDLEPETPLERRVRAYGFSEAWMTCLQHFSTTEQQQMLEALALRAPTMATVHPNLHHRVRVLDSQSAPSTRTRFSMLISEPSLLTPLLRQAPWGVRFQDEGSVILSTQTVHDLPSVNSALRVLDYCAGAGGKTFVMRLALAERTHARLLLWDQLRYHLLQEMTGPAPGLPSVTVLPKSFDAATSTERFEVVLCDVPCSQTGVVRRHPELRWQDPTALASSHLSTQEKILELASHVVTPGGVLVYATCSLLAQENQDQLQRFLALRPDFEAAPWPSVSPWISQDILYKVKDPHGVQLLPEQNSHDGFYFARVRRKFS